MGKNYGKTFEIKFKECWKKSFPDSFLLRLYDTTNGYTGVRNPCDFIGFVRGKLFLLETKAHEGNTFPLVNLTQYDKLISYNDITGVNPYVILWFVDHDKVVAVPIKEVEKMKADGKKSVNIKMLSDKSYNLIEIPSVKKRVFLDTDYTILEEVSNG